MREAEFAEKRDPVAFTAAIARCRPLAHAIHRENRSTFERGRKERRRGVRFMMLGEKKQAIVLQSFPDQRGHPELLFEPQWHCHEERTEPAGSGGKVRFEDAFELQQRFVIEDHSSKIRCSDATLLEAVGDGLCGEIEIVLLAGKALFLCRGNDPAIGHQGGGRVMIKTGNTQDIGWRGSHGGDQSWKDLMYSTSRVQSSRVSRRAAAPPCLASSWYS